MTAQRVLLVDSICDVPLERLQRGNVRGIICDLDNTLVAHGTERVTHAVVAWLSGVRAAGIQVAIVSNSRDEKRVERVAREVGAIYIARARKPWPAAFERARVLLATARESTIVVGDKLFTDILGSRLAGFDAILVRPIVASEEMWMRPFRLAERAYLRWGGSALDNESA